MPQICGKSLWQNILLGCQTAHTSAATGVGMMKIPSSSGFAAAFFLELGVHHEQRDIWRGTTMIRHVLRQQCLTLDMN
jgi:hypothetical protein